ncbi:MAG TPA: sulfatase-like hydrolase/transferase, partial [Thermoanaerobaculia bacterium]
MDYLHSTLPHRPLCFLPSGRLYGQRVTVMPQTGEVWRLDRQYALDTHQRHLLQLRYADRLLGDLVAALKERDLFDESALVVTADHGESFAFGYASRLPAQTPHPEDILRIPLLVKAPRQRAGAVSEVSVRSVDLLPRRRWLGHFLGLRAG